MRAVPLVAVGVTGLVLGAALGYAAARVDGTEPKDDERAQLLGEGELADVPRGPVAVRAERVVLPAGFVSRHRHGGPTFNFVDAGTVVIEDDRGRVRYGAGGFFFEPGGHVHSITVVDDARLRVIRLVPPGVEATTEVP